ncbi:hypothetical protein [Arcticibacterium luteifluviistationis]|uniref:Uncharacterized protein n=1 Tax=Arcticibacterium luteifluviistationis TaxID=1784714 RepID=A0A2Z4GAC3_9BACT|nr:hypothetical protein [Arcticibacterium luteifluviistationis]AWV98209.1 hypothetical protein DJ013_08490 [Arcticibacterium luteifluviistationis]
MKKLLAIFIFVSITFSSVSGLKAWQLDLAFGVISDILGSSRFQMSLNQEVNDIASPGRLMNPLFFTTSMCEGSSSYAISGFSSEHSIHIYSTNETLCFTLPVRTTIVNDEISVIPTGIMIHANPSNFIASQTFNSGA